jgi:hypothetical protein
MELLNRFFEWVAYLFLGEGTPYAGLVGAWIVFVMVILLVLAGGLVWVGYALGSL